LKPLFYLVSQEQEQESEQKWRTWVDERFVKVRALPHKHPLQWFAKPKPVFFRAGFDCQYLPQYV
jgi:hypothetical protein